MALCEPERRAKPDTKFAGKLIWNFQAPENVKDKFTLLMNCPVSGILSQQPQQDRDAGDLDCF